MTIFVYSRVGLATVFYNWSLFSQQHFVLNIVILSISLWLLPSWRMKITYTVLVNDLRIPALSGQLVDETV